MMRHVITILSLFLVSSTFCQEINNTRENLARELIENGGVLSILVNYSIGEASYSEQEIFIVRQDDALRVKIFVDSSSFFVKHKGFYWSDTSFVIADKYFVDLIDFEDKLFTKGIRTTYNCDGKDGQIVHNMTFIAYFYDKVDSLNFDNASKDQLRQINFSKYAKNKMIIISGGFLSIRDELMNLGLKSSTCKTYWYD